MLAIGLSERASLRAALSPLPRLQSRFWGLRSRWGLESACTARRRWRLMQERVDPECMGRVFGLYGAVCSWAMPVGPFASTLFADAIGVSACFVLIGAAMVILAGSPGDPEHPQDWVALWRSAFRFGRLVGSLRREGWSTVRLRGRRRPPFCLFVWPGADHHLFAGRLRCRCLPIRGSLQLCASHRFGSVSCS